MLYKMAHEGEAPKIFGYVSKHIVPSHAIWGITGGIFIGFMINVLIQFFNKSLANIFVVVYSSSVLPGMVAWFVILLAELRFRKKNPHLMKNHPFKLPLYPYSNYFALLMLTIIVIFMFINPDTRISVTVGALFLIAAAVIYVIRHKKQK